MSLTHSCVGSVPADAPWCVQSPSPSLSSPHLISYVHPIHSSSLLLHHPLRPSPLPLCLGSSVITSSLLSSFDWTSCICNLFIASPLLSPLSDSLVITPLLSGLLLLWQVPFFTPFPALLDYVCVLTICFLTYRNAHIVLNNITHCLWGESRFGFRCIKKTKTDQNCSDTHKITPMLSYTSPHTLCPLCMMWRHAAPLISSKTLSEKERWTAEKEQCES